MVSAKAADVFSYSVLRLLPEHLTHKLLNCNAIIVTVLINLNIWLCKLTVSILSFFLSVFSFFRKTVLFVSILENPIVRGKSFSKKKRFLIRNNLGGEFISVYRIDLISWFCWINGNYHSIDNCRCTLYRLRFKNLIFVHFRAGAILLTFLNTNIINKILQKYFIIISLPFQLYSS